MSINKYGIKMHGLRQACSETKGLHGYYSGEYVQISYDKNTGDILTNYHYSIGQNSWTQYHNPSIITLCNICSPMTMQGIADLIHEKLNDPAYNEAW